MKLPKKLMKEPLVDALFEIRFVPTVPNVSGVLPGMLLSKLQPSWNEPFTIERLQAAEIPSQMRLADPFMKYQPLFRLSGASFGISVGDWNVAVSCVLPYAGWAAFKPKIIDVMDALTKSNFVKELERYSMKYVDIVEHETLHGQIERANMEIRIGPHKLSDDLFDVRMEMKVDEFTNLLHVASQATAALPNGVTRSGLLIDVDTVVNHRTAHLGEFMDELPDRLEKIHTENKTRVFTCLTPEAIQELEPIYGDQ